MQKQFFLLLLILLLITLAGEQKFTIAVLKLKNAAGVSKGEADIITDRLRIELFKTENVEVMEREQMQTILREQGFQASGVCSDEGCMVEMGQLLGVQRLITGSIGRLGNLYLLNIRSIDVQTAQIDKVVSEDIDGGIEEVAKRLADIAWNLTSSEKRKKPEPKKNIFKRKKQTVTKSAHLPSPFKCKETVFLEAVNFSTILPFKVEKDTYEEINSDIQEAIEDAVEEEIDDDLDVEILTPSQILQLPTSCRSGLARVSLESYRTRRSGLQNIAKARASFYFYRSPHSARPVFKITIEDEGDRDLGDQEPLMNVMEEIAEELEDQLEDSEYIDYLDPNKK